MSGVDYEQTYGELYHRQLENERKQVEGGIADFQMADAKARWRGRAGLTRAGIWLTETCMAPMTVEVTRIVEEALEGRSGKNFSAIAGLQALLEMPSGKIGKKSKERGVQIISYITIRTIIDLVCRQAVGKTNVAGVIGRRLAEEIEHRDMRLLGIYLANTPTIP